MKELLFSVTKNDLEVQVFRCGGKGGQKQNKTSSGVRIIHKESGARGESREERSQAQNKKAAFRRLVDSPEFQTWLRLKTAALLKGHHDAERMVDAMMVPENIKVETYEPK